VASFKERVQASVAFGYKHVFVGIELTLAEMLGHADSTLLNTRIERTVGARREGTVRRSAAIRVVETRPFTC